MKRYIERIKNQYDYILIDGMPSLGMLTINVGGNYETDPDEALHVQITMQALSDSKERYSDCVRTGIDAITLKAQGYKGVDIADRFGVKQNYLAACISRAQKYLKQDKKFLQMIG